MQGRTFAKRPSAKRPSHSIAESCKRDCVFDIRSFTIFQYALLWLSGTIPGNTCQAALPTPCGFLYRAMSYGIDLQNHAGLCRIPQTQRSAQFVRKDAGASFGAFCKPCGATQTPSASPLWVSPRITAESWGMLKATGGLLKAAGELRRSTENVKNNFKHEDC